MIIKNEQREFLEQLILHSNDQYVNGLFNGRMGVVLCLATYAHKYKQKMVESAADFLMEQITNSITEAVHIGLADGLSGIGWGIEYLVQNKFMKGNTVESCYEIDQKLMEHAPKRLTDFSLENGLEGILHYVTIHLAGNYEGKSPFDQIYLQELYDVTCELPDNISDSFRNQCMLYQHIYEGKKVIIRPDVWPFICLPVPLPNKWVSLGLHSGLAGFLMSFE